MFNKKKLIIIFLLTVLTAKDKNWSLSIGSGYPLSTGINSLLYISVYAPYNFKIIKLNFSPLLTYNNFNIDKSWMINEFGAGFQTEFYKNYFLEYYFTKFDDKNRFKTFNYTQNFLLAYAFKISHLDLKLGPFLKVLNGTSSNSSYAGLGLSIGIGTGKGKNKSNSGPSAKASKGGSILRPKSTGNSTIDAFVTDSYDLNDKIVDLKGTLKEVSKGLKESNAILSSINSHPDGPLGWASAELAKGTSRSVNNAKADELGSVDPGQFLREELSTLKSGIVGGSTKLKSIPDDLKDIGNQAKSLLSSATALPNEAKSLGLKAPKALKAIKTTSGVLKNIPNQVTSIGSETKQVLSQIDAALTNIQGLFGRAQS